MSEHNQIKDRKCKYCTEVVRGKAHKLKEHHREHHRVLKETAEQAIMKKLQEEMEGEQF